MVQETAIASQKRQKLMVKHTEKWENDILKGAWTLGRRGRLLLRTNFLLSHDAAVLNAEAEITLFKKNLKI